MEQAEEIKKMIESASNGYWVPVAIVTAAFSVIIGLLLHIWNQMLKHNERRHQDHEKHNNKQDTILEEITKTTQALTIMVTEIKTRQEVTLSKK